MILAAAQIRTEHNDTVSHVNKHLHIVDEAARYGAQLIVFPEMSLTGYERELASLLAFAPNDARLQPLYEKACEHEMTVIAGAPISLNGELLIGSFIIQPNKSIKVYSKQFLYEGETDFFTVNPTLFPVVALQREIVSTAICFDINYARQAQMAADKGSTLYTAGIFYEPRSMERAYQNLSTYAREHRMKVLMANLCGSTYGCEAAGQSAFWDDQGKLIGQLNNNEEGLLLASDNSGVWKAQQVYLSTATR